MAVIIGNKGYESERVPEVAYAHRDADAFRRYVLDVLGFNPDNVIDLRDASQAEMETAFGNERSHEGKVWRYLHPRHGSDVVVFYSGHGVPGLKDRRGYLLPVDADPDSAEINGYPIDVLYGNLSELEAAKSVRVFLDACFSGDSDRGMLVRSASPVFVPAALPAASGDKLTVLAAASGEEVASWDDAARHGLFTHHLMNALYGAGDADGDGRVTAVEVKTYLDDTMTLAARREFGRHQNASLNGVAGAVLASVGPGGTFPPRPVLNEEEATAGGTAEKEEVPPPPADAQEVVASSPAVEPPEETARESPEALESALRLSRARRVQIQRGLAALGFDAGPADGLFGRRTRAAVAAWQKAKGLPETGHLNAVQASALAARGAEAAEAQAEAEERERNRLAEEARRKAEEERQREAKEAERRRAEADRRADDEVFARAKSLGTVAAYREYLRRYPSGRHASEARRLRDEASNRKQVGEKFRDCTQCPEMVVVPAGSFQMGSPSHETERDRTEGPVHQVRIPEPFAVGVYEVTRGQWNAFVSETGHGRDNECRHDYESTQSDRIRGYGPSDRHPAVCVSWKDARSYVRWLSRKTGHQYRLPSEAEWEYVARAGTRTSRWWGNSKWEQCQHANGVDRSFEERLRHELRKKEDWKTVETHIRISGGIVQCDDRNPLDSAVGTYGSNRFGLHDVLGNVGEWTADCRNDSYQGAPRDGGAWMRGDCSQRMVRGGSWAFGPRALRSASRNSFMSGIESLETGFRVVRALSP